MTSFTCILRTLQDLGQLFRTNSDRSFEHKPCWAHFVQTRSTSLQSGWWKSKQHFVSRVNKSDEHEEGYTPDSCTFGFGTAMSTVGGFRSSACELELVSTSGLISGSLHGRVGLPGHQHLQSWPTNPSPGHVCWGQPATKASKSTKTAKVITCTA